MPIRIRRADYFYATVEEEPDQAYDLLTQLASLGINMLAFTATPNGPERTQFSLFPENAEQLREAARKAGLTLDGPHRALLVQGDDELGALARIHSELHRAQVTVYASTGVTDGDGSFGYLLYLRSDDYEKAMKALAL